MKNKYKIFKYNLNLRIHIVFKIIVLFWTLNRDFIDNRIMKLIIIIIILILPVLTIFLHYNIETFLNANNQTDKLCENIYPWFDFIHTWRKTIHQKILGRNRDAIFSEHKKIFLILCLSNTLLFLWLWV